MNKTFMVIFTLMTLVMMIVGSVLWEQWQYKIHQEEIEQSFYDGVFEGCVASYGIAKIKNTGTISSEDIQLIEVICEDIRDASQELDRFNEYKLDGLQGQDS